jgi:hypothetical protein
MEKSSRVTGIVSNSVWYLSLVAEFWELILCALFLVSVMKQDSTGRLSSLEDNPAAIAL